MMLRSREAKRAAVAANVLWAFLPGHFLIDVLKASTASEHSPRLHLASISLSARFLAAACPHSFEEAAHLQGLVLGLRGVDPLAQAGDSQIILYPDEPLDFGNLRMKRINLLLNEWTEHFGLHHSENLAPTLLWRV
jgi:hypothetical protein